AGGTRAPVPKGVFGHVELRPVDLGGGLEARLDPELREDRVERGDHAAVDLRAGEVEGVELVEEGLVQRAPVGLSPGRVLGRAPVPDRRAESEAVLDPALDLPGGL